MRVRKPGRFKATPAASLLGINGNENKSLRRNLTPQRHHLVVCPAFDQPHDVRRNRFHDPLVFVGITVQVVNVGDAALLVVLDAVPGVAAELERGS